MKRFVIYNILIVLLIFTVGCGTDSLESQSTEQIPLDDIENYNSEEGAKSLTTAIYSTFTKTSPSIGFDMLGPMSLGSDEANKGSTRGDDGNGLDKFANLTVTPSIPALSNTWDVFYQIINRSNQALRFLPELDEVEEETRVSLEGEAKFMRAYAYFNLVRLWGDVPLMKDVYEEGKEEDLEAALTRVSAEEIYDFIEEDLKEASEALKEKSELSGEDKGRATVGAAHGLWAKVALYREDWAKAAEQADLVEGYSLASDYQENFKKEGINNSESIFELGGVGGEGKPGIPIYSQGQGPRGSGAWGWGFNNPSQTLIDAFDAEGDDQRKEATVIFRPDVLYDGREIPDDVQNPYYNYKAYASENHGAASTNAHIKVLRYSEVLLIAAEAINEGGQSNKWSNPEDPLNEVRARAGLSPTTANGQNELREAIWNERRLELAMEWDRWFDIIRTGQAKEAIETYNANQEEDRALDEDIVFEEGKNELWPLPQSFLDEVEENGMSVEQNPGY